MKYFFGFLLGFISCLIVVSRLNKHANSKNHIVCEERLPNDVYFRQMKDESWVIMSNDYGETYYFVKDNHIDNSGWLNAGWGGVRAAIHYSDSCSAKEDFQSFMNHKTFK